MTAGEANALAARGAEAALRDIISRALSAIKAAAAEGRFQVELRNEKSLRDFLLVQGYRAEPSEHGPWLVVSWERVGLDEHTNRGWRRLFGKRLPAARVAGE